MFDLAIIGGGINGCGIARDAAGRGVSVVLHEQGDLAGATSSASTKLIHGGLRYLEQYEFGLVRAALAEREVLWRMAPHLIRPLRFVLPHQPGMRPRWMLRAGLFLYDHLARRALLPAASALDLRHDPAGAALRSDLTHGFAYFDCAVDDARLAILNARDAADRGASIRVRSRVERIERQSDHWRLSARDEAGNISVTQARILVNAAGPWVDAVQNLAIGRASHPVRLVQGSHIVVPRLHGHDSAYIFQNPDGRIVFVIPYEDDYTLIGTTDRDYAGDPAAVTAGEDERAYLCAAASAYLKTPITPADIVWAYSGVRPLADNGKGAARDATRDYVLDLDTQGPPLLSIFGGKITTFRRLAEAALTRLAPHLPAAAARRWTAGSTLPGGDFEVGELPGIEAEIVKANPGLAASLARRLVRLYGTGAYDVLAHAEGGDLGRHFGAGLHECEVRYLVDNEWARSAADILWRRTKLGLAFDATATAALDDYIHQLTSARRAAAA